MATSGRWQQLQQLWPTNLWEKQTRRSRLKERLNLQSACLDEYEEKLLEHVVLPDSIAVQLEDVFGLDELITTLEDEVLRFLDPQMRSLVSSSPLWSLVKGLLLYGPPGTGKTMLAKALTKRASCRLINIAPSAINSKYFGDANRLVKATFTLARKLQPCIIFVDEVDALLSRRGSLSEHEGSLQVKNEFLALWDGLDSDADTGVLVMGTTNRIDRMDEAALRRFSLRRALPLPGEAQRRAILAGYLRKHAAAAPRVAAPEQRLQTDLLQEVDYVTADCQRQNPQAGSSNTDRRRCAAPIATPILDDLAARTEGFSGSDIYDLCSKAARSVLSDPRVRERLRTQASSRAGVTAGGGTDNAAAAGDAGNGSTQQQQQQQRQPDLAALLRPLAAEDLRRVLDTMRKHAPVLQQQVQPSALPLPSKPAASTSRRKYCEINTTTSRVPDDIDDNNNSPMHRQRTPAAAAASAPRRRGTAAARIAASPGAAASRSCVRRRRRRDGTTADDADAGAFGGGGDGTHNHSADADAAAATVVDRDDAYRTHDGGVPATDRIRVVRRTTIWDYVVAGAGVCAAFAWVFFLL